MYDIMIIGAGVVGCAIARELSRFDLDVAVIDKEEEVACGTSKANSGIVHAGYDPVPGTLKARLNVEGNGLFDRLSEELDFPFKRIGSLVLAFSEADIKTLADLKNRGEENGVNDLRIISGEELKIIEPEVSKEAEAALYAPSGGITGPYEMNIALAENAAANGVCFIMGAQVKSIEWTGSCFRVTAGNMVYSTRYLINSAGVNSDLIAEMAEKKRRYKITPRLGEYCLLDKYSGGIVNKILFQVPGLYGKGILVVPTVEGNVLLGPTARDVECREDAECTAPGLAEVILKARKSVPGLDHRYIITSFAGLRSSCGNKDFIIEASSEVPNLINLIGIESPGLTAAPAIGHTVAGMIRKAGLPFIEKSRYDPIRPKVARFAHMDNTARKALIEKDLAYGNIICRCEMVTEGEILDAIRRPMGARTLDGVKRRVRAGSGRCQGSFCSAKIVDILARELSVSHLEVTKKGGKSRILACRNKELQGGEI